jgi:glycosyltransferase involved in cell wall biosynthesis
MLDEVAVRQPRLRAIHQKNTGHGGALLRGYQEALTLDPRYVFQCDSDNQFLPEDFGQLWERRHDSVCILGFRSERHDALHRLVITRILRLVLFVCFRRYLRDSNIPFRLFDAAFLRSALALIPPTTFAPNIFLAVVAARQDIPLLHLPVRHRDRTTGTVSIVRWKLIKICFRCVRELCAFRCILARTEAGGGQH